MKQARAAAAERMAGTPWRTNGEVPGTQMRALWGVPPAVMRRAEELFERGQLTARGLDRVLRTAWTLADLAGDPAPDSGHVEQALGLRLSAGAW